MTINAIIFDLDGTLLYTLEDLKNSVNYALKELNLPQRSLEEIRNFVGNGIYKLIERSVGENSDKIEACLEIFKIHYSKTSKNNTKPYSGVIEGLKKLKSKGIKLAVLSNKIDFAVKDLTDTYFNGIFDISRGELPDFPKKPDPKSCFDILKKLKVKKEEALFVGDSEVDIQTANNAEIMCLSALWGYKEKDFLIKNGAKVMIKNFEEIFNYL